MSQAPWPSTLAAEPAAVYNAPMRPARCTLLVLLAACAQQGASPESAGPTEPEWISLFNGEDLDDWQIKIRGFELGDNHADTFRVEDGLLRVAYDGYESFDGRFGHIFYRTPFDHYRLLLEYRFVGEQVPGGAGWAWRNSGAMLHCQAPETMTVDQEFPASIEAQLLGGDGERSRSTANLCTPGTNVVMDDELTLRHCINSSSATFHGDRWVTVELEVRGHEVIRHWIEGQVVLEYTEPQLDPRDGDARRLLSAGSKKELDSGWIALQSESHPIEFRRVELLPLR